MKYYRLSLIFCLLIMLTCKAGYPAKREISLRGTWKFELGDHEEWADPAQDDFDWVNITVPGNWEDKDFPGYDGFAWYRKTLVIPKRLASEVLELHLGQIDDVDEVFFNGTRIGGRGSFPPHFRTAYSEDRIYPIPAELIRFGQENVIAVRVYDNAYVGGIQGYRPGIYSRKDIFIPTWELSGDWLFKTGDDLRWRKANLDDSAWNPIEVPHHWETAGYEDYDGFAWYRLHFNTPNDAPQGALMLLLGKIDDVDEVYFNGVTIGKTGRMPKYEGEHMPTFNSWWEKQRVYKIPEELLRHETPNVVAVRVFDIWLDGGIYSGPIGLITERDYRKRLNSWFEIPAWLENFFKW